MRIFKLIVVDIFFIVLLLIIPTMIFANIYSGSSCRTCAMTSSTTVWFISIGALQMVLFKKISKKSRFVAWVWGLFAGLVTYAALEILGTLVSYFSVSNDILPGLKVGLQIGFLSNAIAPLVAIFVSHSVSKDKKENSNEDKQVV